MNLPVRKCYHAAKIAFFLILVVTILSLFEHWRGGKRSAGAQIYDPEDEYEKEILEDEARIIPGLGEGGVAAHLIGEAKRLGEESEKKLAINVYLSDRIAYNRTLKDYRNPACQRVVYDAELPSASVILIFHNEPYSVVIRTIWSVLNSARRDNPWFAKANYINRETGKTMKLGYPGQDERSPYVYLKEIILVDDNSTLPELKGKLSHYVRTRLPPDLIRILRLPDRQGLMRARITGARAARGHVLVFLDAHCEAGADWLRPLLQRIRHKRDAVLTPLIDVVDQTTFQLEAAQQFQVGGFTFMGHFTWIDVPEREKKRRGSDIAPTWSPTMAGGLFAINRAYYWELGAYDEQMAGWGGENLEMSFRIWQCGGTLETIPCSRVGHVFRSFHPYGLPAHTDTHGINTARMAEVWMDDYAELFYLHRPDLRKNPKIGDVTHRRVLREKLKCKSFQWYLDNVYREKFVPVRDVFGFGRFRNARSGRCLDSLQRDGEAAALGVYACHARLQPTQHFALSLRGELRDEEKCAEVQYARNQGEMGEDVTRRVLMVTCHGKQRGQKWRYLPSRQLQHVDSGLCLSVGVGEEALARRCRRSDAQLWDIDYSELNDFHLDDNPEPSEQEIKLRKLRGQRRVSRSLLYHEESNSTRRHKHKHRNKHKKSKKNKFILKLVRDSNNTEEHLEVDVYCKHRRLYPNNTFVRDLVTILNEKDIKVVNNGRVFEHNKVSALVKRERDHTPEPHHDDQAVASDKSQMKRKRKKPKIQPLEDASAVDVANIADIANALDADAPRDLDKKIIIEDFVEVTPKVTTTRATKKRQRGRARGGRGGSAPRTTTAVWEDSMHVETVASVEDTPMLASVERRDDTSENWHVGKASFRRNNTHSTEHRRGSEHIYTSDEVVSGTTVVAPVKVVMRSNLTFNFGDEFFRWRKRTADDVANLLGELMIPASTYTPIRSRADTDTEQEKKESERDGDTTSEKDKEIMLSGRTDVDSSESESASSD
ncbi:polypeptide N-acetylgalactosaminyltransferase 1-like isoform X2 [Nymphalis io]|uniref:polypeptide N-acetylgalactosaminyltransferase 1-like isoform X2 n=1 Tax=Inachis io TaxID=171585 RepID=UPI0021683490|nr:polypeptide N-acetylgalactosaminyltransferase 1-like isoform X2 [Nymphalis io]